MSTGMETGSLAEWAGAFAAIIGTFISLFALWYAHKANETAEATRKDTREASEKALALEAQREKRLVAGSLQAWWARAELDEAEGWGVVVSNLGPTRSVFREVEIAVDGNKYSDSILLEVVPPGQFFVESVHDGWSLPRPINTEEYDSLTKSHFHRIRSIRFTDQLGTKWTWNPTDGPTETRQSSGQ